MNKTAINYVEESGVGTILLTPPEGKPPTLDGEVHFFAADPLRELVFVCLTTGVLEDSRNFERMQGLSDLALGALVFWLYTVLFFFGIDDVVINALSAVFAAGFVTSGYSIAVTLPELSRVYSVSWPSGSVCEVMKSLVESGALSPARDGEDADPGTIATHRGQGYSVS